MERSRGGRRSLEGDRKLHERAARMEEVMRGHANMQELSNIGTTNIPKTRI